MAGGSRSFDARTNQRSADATPLTGRLDTDWSQRGEAANRIAIRDGNQAVRAVPDDGIIQQRHMRQPQLAVITQLVDDIGDGFLAKGGAFDGVNALDVGRLFVAD